MSDDTIFRSFFKGKKSEPADTSPKVGFGDTDTSTGQGSQSPNQMSSLTQPPSGQAASTRREPAQAQTVAASTSPPSLDELLLTKMDGAVATFSEIMSDNSVLVSGEGESRKETPRYTFSERMKAAEFVRDWIVRRRKLQPATVLDDDAPNITALREAIRLQIEETLEAKRVVTLPPPKVGRPTKEEAAQRKELDEVIAKAKLDHQHDDILADLNPKSEDDELKRALRGEQ